MNKYDAENSCNKCGCTVTKDKFGIIEKTGEEAIRRECVRCGYVWLELPLDAEEDDNDSQS